MTKTCFRCERDLPRSEFYRHAETSDGLLGKCKDCTKADVKAYKATPRGRELTRGWKTTPRSLRLNVARSQRQRKAEPEKYKARSAVGHALRKGSLTRKPCELCGDKKSQAHHEDYSRPLDVIWLCFYCHREAHGRPVERPAQVDF
jgi:hypothetical protein